MDLSSLTMARQPKLPVTRVLKLLGDSVVELTVLLRSSSPSLL